MDYHFKYDRISKIIDDNPDILNAVHKDLKNYGNGEKRECPFSSEQILRVALVKDIEQWTFRNTIIRINESDFLRNFTRIGMGKVMSHTFLCSALNKIQPSTWQTVNGLLDTHALKEKKISPAQLRADSTVCETNIHFPTDNGLLWDCYRVISRTIRNCSKENPVLNCQNRFHEKKVKKLYTYIATHSGRKNKQTQRKIKRNMKVLIARVSALCDTARNYIEHAEDVCGAAILQFSLIIELRRQLSLAEKVVDQSYRIHVCNEKVPASEKIFSIFEEHTELFKRGKAQKPVEFGHLVTIAQTKEKYISFYDVRKRSLHDSEMKDIILDSHKEKFGSLPEKFTADKNYYVSMDDIAQLEEDMEICAIGKKGKRSVEEYEREHSDEFTLMQKFRAGVEGTISFLKRMFGLTRCINRGFKHFASTIGRAIFCHNLVVLSRI